MEPTSRSATAQLEVTATRGVIVITTDTGDPDIAAARAVAGKIGARCDVPVMLYDRSDETWGDTQHPEGPLRPDDTRLEGRTHLVSQMAELTGMGARPLAWVATLPSISAIETALAEFDADVVVVPEALERHLLERALRGDSLSAAVAVQLGKSAEHDPMVLGVSADGRVRPVADS